MFEFINMRDISQVWRVNKINQFLIKTGMATVSYVKVVLISCDRGVSGRHQPFFQSRKNKVDMWYVKITQQYGFDTNLAGHRPS